MNILLKNLCVFGASMIVLSAHAQYKIEVLDSNTFQLGEGVVLSKTSFRGLSVVDDHTVWVSGSRGTIARSVDGGKSFTYTQLKGYEKSDFRDIEAFDDKRAVIMSSGTPAYILKTTDGGQSWKEVYKNTDTAYFLDAMDFWDEKRGMLVGDPIQGHFLLMQSKDGGDTWEELDTSRTPKAMEGEAVFAASGTSLRCWGKDAFGFVSGGSVARFFASKNPPIKLNLKQGQATKGAFSFIQYGKTRFVVSGGDYLEKDSIGYNTCTIGNMILLAEKPNYLNKIHDLAQFSSCIELLSYKSGMLILISCGTSGVSVDNIGWAYISSDPFHVVRRAKNGKAVFLAGPKGRIGKLIYEPQRR